MDDKPNLDIDFQIPDLPELPDSCPISELIGKRVTQMTDDELERHLMSLRSAVESPQALRKMVSKKGASGGAKKKTAGVNLSILGL